MTVDARLHELGRNARRRRGAIAILIGAPIVLSGIAWAAREAGWIGALAALAVGAAIVRGVRASRDALDRRGVDRAPARCRRCATRGQRRSPVPRCRRSFAAAAAAARAPAPAHRNQRAGRSRIAVAASPARHRVGFCAACDRARAVRAAYDAADIGLRAGSGEHECARDAARSHPARCRGTRVHALAGKERIHARRARSRRRSHRVAPPFRSAADACGARVPRRQPGRARARRRRVDRRTHAHRIGAVSHRARRRAACRRRSPAPSRCNRRPARPTCA